jgi:hypothetical protein
MWMRTSSQNKVRQVRVQVGSVTFNPSLTAAEPPVTRAGWRRSVGEGARPKV